MQIASPPFRTLIDMEPLENFLARHARVELLEYEIRPSERVVLVFLGYPSVDDDLPVATRYELVFKKPSAIEFERIACPTGALTKVDLRANKDRHAASFEFENAGRIDMSFAELVRV